MVHLFLLKGADKDAFDHTTTSTPLYLAIHQGQAATTQALMAAGADVNLRCGDVTPAIHRAAHNGHVGILRAVIEYGADVEADVVTNQ